MAVIIAYRQFLYLLTLPSACFDSNTKECDITASVCFAQSGMQ